MCAWLITMALGLAIVGCSNEKMTTTTQTTVQQSETAAVNTSNSTKVYIRMKILILHTRIRIQR